RRRRENRFRPAEKAQHESSGEVCSESRTVRNHRSAHITSRRIWALYRHPSADRSSFSDSDLRLFLNRIAVLCFERRFCLATAWNRAPLVKRLLIISHNDIACI